MRNKKIITLLLAATVAITSVAPSIQVKASDIILVPSGNGGYTVSTATGSSVATATPVPTAIVTETPVSNSDEKRWYSYRGIKYWMNNASGCARVIDKCLCGKKVVKMSRAAIRKHIDECIKTDGHPESTKKKTTNESGSYFSSAYVGKDVIDVSEDYDFLAYKNRKDIVLNFGTDGVSIMNLPVKKGTKVTFQLKGNRKYKTKVKKEFIYYEKDNGKGSRINRNSISYYYDTTNTKCRVTYGIYNNKTKKYKYYEDKYFSNYKKAKKYMKKHHADESYVNYIGMDELTIKIKGYGTYVFRVDKMKTGCGSTYKIANLRNK